tara:strand:- start:84 stop:269 length:186 start_codon:yes stop_codon:yes gene_type:complete
MTNSDLIEEVMYDAWSYGIGLEVFEQVKRYEQTIKYNHIADLYVRAFNEQINKLKNGNKKE